MPVLYDEMMDSLVRYELAMADFYGAVGKQATVHQEVWQQLSREEKEHAGIINRIRRRFHHLIVMTNANMHETIDQVSKNLWLLDTLRWRLDHQDLNDEELVQTAVNLELSTGELRINQILEQGQHHPDLEEYYTLLGQEEGHERLLLEL